MLILTIRQDQINHKSLRRVQPFAQSRLLSKLERSGLHTCGVGLTQSARPPTWR